MEEPFVGMIELFPYDFVPEGWALCAGQAMSIMQNQALYSLIGVKYGGNASTTFNLPDLRNAVPIPGMRFCISMQGLYPVRS
ncbi:phage tail protein [Anaeromicropila populeti]|uniref:Phage Tail Collar Domain n=1 Tax=Anaeromicropila populeti TaxID=37658 RepID=A0A1I6J8S0_9FIRM|nr:phage tail protein [Anaeromicropila populeti]SFR75366.1 Phage Tail Collar Domain [Anaeromicropila populeti]